MPRTILCKSVSLCIRAVVYLSRIVNFRVQQQRPSVTLFVVHDLMLASRCGHQILVLHKGKIHAHGKAEEVLTPELVAEVYGVTSHVARTPDGCYTVLPGSPS